MAPQSKNKTKKIKIESMRGNNKYMTEPNKMAMVELVPKLELGRD